MKTKLFSLLIIVMLLVTAIPASVFAAAPQDLTLHVRNRTGVAVELNLQDANGNISFYTVAEGVSEMTLTEGVYSYWADLPCGHIAGTWNVNVVKTLFLSCDNAMPTVYLTRIQKGGTCMLGAYVTITQVGDHSPAVGTWFFSEEFSQTPAQEMYDEIYADLNDAGTDEGSTWIGCWDGSTPKDLDIQWSGG